MNKKSIHYVMWQIGQGGMELSVKSYVEYFGDDRELHVYSLRKIETQIYDESKIQVHVGAEGIIQRYWNYFKYCRKNKNQIFHLLNAGPIILFISLMAGIKNPIYHIRGTIYWKKKIQKYYLKFLWWICSLFPVQYLANSNYSASIFKEKVLSKNVKVIYNGFEVNKFLNKKSLRKTPNRIGYAGRIVPGKNVKLVIQLFESVAIDFPKLELHLAGKGSLLPELKDYVAKSRFKNRIKFLGFVEDVSSFYSSMDLLVFLSAYESFGNILVEALLTGLPILTSDIEVFNEIHGGESGFLLGNPENFSELKNKLLNALNNYDELAEKGFYISNRVEELFNVENHLNKIDSIYRNEKMLQNKIFAN